MARLPIEKEKFYSELLELMSSARQSVHFYSVSCCFGFYSRGLSTFESVLLGIRDSMSRLHGGRFLDIRVLLKIDHDNPIDVYAAERLAHLESKFAHTGNTDDNRNVFREIGRHLTDIEAVQFLIVDDEQTLLSAQQEESYNENLDLVLNTSQRAMKFDKSDSPDEFRKYSDMFQNTWNDSTTLDVEVKQVSRRKLKHLLERYRGAHRVKSERELNLLLTGYLQGLFDPSIVDLEAPVGGTRVDLLVGPRPHSKRHGIEVKLACENDSIDGIVGQIRKYRKEYENLVLVVAQPKYSPQRRKDLVDELDEIDVSLIELP